MTEDTKDVSVAGEEEVTAPPTPEISAGSPPVSSEQPGVDVDALADKILERLEPSVDNKIDARFKSGKDTRFSKVDEIYEWVKASGGDPEQIRGALEQSSLRNEIENLKAQISSGASGKAPAGNFQADIADILNEAGIEPDDPEVAEWGSKTYTSESEALKSLTRLGVKRAKQGNVTAAAAVSPSGGAAPIEDDSYEGLAAQLAGMRGKYDPETTEKRREIRAKMDELQGSLNIQEVKHDALGSF
jgi:hypothetical protein